MGWHTIKRTQADNLFSKYIREKRGWRCENCGKYCRIHGEIVAQLECSHYFSRRCWSTRFDENNVLSLCSNCHKRMGGYTKAENSEYDLFMKKKLGMEEYNKLKIRAHAYVPRDKTLTLMFVKELIKQNAS